MVVASCIRVIIELIRNVIVGSDIIHKSLLIHSSIMLLNQLRRLCHRCIESELIYHHSIEVEVSTDLHHVIKVLCSCEVYQLNSVPR